MAPAARMTSLEQVMFILGLDLECENYRRYSFSKIRWTVLFWTYLNSDGPLYPIKCRFAVAQTWVVHLLQENLCDHLFRCDVQVGTVHHRIEVCGATVTPRLVLCAHAGGVDHGTDTCSVIGLGREGQSQLYHAI